MKKEGCGMKKIQLPFQAFLRKNLSTVFQTYPHEFVGLF